MISLKTGAAVSPPQIGSGLVKNHQATSLRPLGGSKPHESGHVSACVSGAAGPAFSRGAGLARHPVVRDRGLVPCPARLRRLSSGSRSSPGRSPRQTSSPSPPRPISFSPVVCHLRLQQVRGVSLRPPFAIAPITQASWIGVSDMPCPMLIVATLVPDHFDTSGTSPETSPGKSTPVGLPQPEAVDVLRSLSLPELAGHQDRPHV